MAEGVLIGIVIGFGAGVLVTVGIGLSKRRKNMDRLICHVLMGGAYIVGMLSGVFTSCLMIASGRYHEEEEKLIGTAEDEKPSQESPEDDQRWSGGRKPE